MVKEQGFGSISNAEKQGGKKKDLLEQYVVEFGRKRSSKYCLRVMPAGLKRHPMLFRIPPVKPANAGI